MAAAVDCRNPATGELIAAYPQHSAADAAAAIARARAVQPAWAARPYRERSACMKKVADQLYANLDALADTISRNNGKTRVDALAAEIAPAILGISFYRKRGARLLRPVRLGGGHLLLFNKKSRLLRQSYGVIGIISPWNYPFSIPFSEVVMALLMGNGVLLKVASDSLAVGEALAAAFQAAGLPDGLFAYLRLPGREAGPAFIDGGVDKLFFTGSTEVGRELMARAADRLLPLVLELGGNDAAIIRADADLDRAADGIAWSGFANAGQSCGGAQRVLVQRSIMEAFTAKLKERVEALRVGPGSSHDSDFGCMASMRQKETVEAQLKACLESGARIVAQSPLDPGLRSGCFMPAIVLADAPPGSPVMRDEVFGPVVALVPYGDDEEAIRLANDSALGLTASVWSKDRRRARAVAARLNAGAVTVNDHLMSHGLAETPWGGFGDSGIGRTHGEAGLLEMLRSKVVVDDIMPAARKDPWWHPYSEKVYRGLKDFVAIAAAKGLGARLGGLFRVIPFFLRYWEKPRAARSRKG